VKARSDALEVGSGLPAWLLRGVIGLAGGALVLVLANSGIGGPALVVLGIGVLLSMVLPASPAPGLVLLLIALVVLASRWQPFSAQVLVMVPLVHLLHVSCGIAGLVPLRSRLHLSALRRPSTRFVAIQAGVFALVGLLAVTPVERPPAVLELGAIVGVAVIAVLVIGLLNRSE
jgi:hypothetical protein